MRSDNSCTGGGISHAAKALSGANTTADTRERERERESKSVAEKRFIIFAPLYQQDPPLKRRGGELSTDTNFGLVGRNFESIGFARRRTYLTSSALARPNKEKPKLYHGQAHLDLARRKHLNLLYIDLRGRYGYRVRRYISTS